MTDYTGLHPREPLYGGRSGQATLDAIQKPGKWLRVQGFISFSRFENDIVLEPLAVQAAEAPVRVDTAPEKRVELHLHTTMSMMDALTKTGRGRRPRLPAGATAPLPSRTTALPRRSRLP